MQGIVKIGHVCVSASPVPEHVCYATPRDHLPILRFEEGEVLACGSVNWRRDGLVLERPCRFHLCGLVRIRAYNYLVQGTAETRDKI